eukprot:CAMPEP_0195133600 /NCGR_PEP_ID=MMETSP0448-20130528/149104_1 /TAXON_ID=66468 /ORGANISM="Heterocapsa triquestra, Strain CCMP 448" /LENGTH=240 /DNA_ID=CAMNT_0040171653 /DNA_START=40 /DNA_END=758 /DNA_ORIENTATION=-
MRLGRAAAAQLPLRRAEQVMATGLLSTPARRTYAAAVDAAMASRLATPRSNAQLGARGLLCVHQPRCMGSSLQLARCFAAQASEAADAGAKPAVAASEAPKSLEERVMQLEAKFKAQEEKLAEVEKLAKRKGRLIQMVMQYGAPFALWYGLVWGSMWFGFYALLESGIVSWQDSLRPLLASIGGDAYADRLDPTLGNVVIAFFVNEMAEPVRFLFVIATGGPVVRFLGRVSGGWLGPAGG